MHIQETWGIKQKERKRRDWCGKDGRGSFSDFFTEQKTIGTLVLCSVRGIKEIPSRREGGELKYESMVDKEKTDAIRDNSNQNLGPLR